MSHADSLTVHLIFLGGMYIGNWGVLGGGGGVGLRGGESSFEVGVITYKFL